VPASERLCCLSVVPCNSSARLVIPLSDRNPKAVRKAPQSRATTDFGTSHMSAACTRCWTAETRAKHGAEVAFGGLGGLGRAAQCRAACRLLQDPEPGKAHCPRFAGILGEMQQKPIVPRHGSRVRHAHDPRAAEIRARLLRHTRTNGSSRRRLEARLLYVCAPRVCVGAWRRVPAGRNPCL